MNGITNCKETWKNAAQDPDDPPVQATGMQKAYLSEAAVRRSACRKPNNGQVLNGLPARGTPERGTVSSATVSRGTLAGTPEKQEHRRTLLKKMKNRG